MSKKTPFSGGKNGKKWLSPRNSDRKKNGDNSNNDKPPKKSPRKFGFQSRRSNTTSQPSSNRNSSRSSSEGKNPPPNTPVLGGRRYMVKKLVEEEQGESPFERIQREDKLLYDCVATLGFERAKFVEYIDWLHAIYREKAISYLDNPTIAMIKSKIPLLLRPCDILFDVKENLLEKEKLKPDDIQALISISNSLGSILKDLPTAIKEILQTTTLLEKPKKQLRELHQVLSNLHKEYNNTIKDLLSSAKEDRKALLTSTPHMKGPHLPYPMKITRQTYNLLNSLDENGVYHKTNATGEHAVTNKRFKVPPGHDESFVQRFVISQHGEIPPLVKNPTGKTKEGDEREVRLFFKRNFPAYETRDQIMPAAERVNGFAIRIRKAHAAPSTFVILDEGVRWRDKDAKPDIISHKKPKVPDHEEGFGERNAVQIGLGVQGHPIEDIEILKIYLKQFQENISEEEFHQNLEIILDLDGCIDALGEEECIEALRACNHMGIITSNDQLRDALPKVADALCYVMKKMDKSDQPKEASAFFDEQKVHRNRLLMDWMKSRKPKDLFHFIARYNAALPLFKKHSLQDILEFCEKLSILRYYFPSAPVSELPKRLNNLYDLISDQEYYNWNKSSMYGFPDCNGGNVFLEPAERENSTGDVKAVLPNDIDHGLGPIGEVQCRDKKLKRRNPKSNEWEPYIKRDHYVGIQSVVQLVPNAQHKIPRECFEHDLDQPEYMVVSEFLKCVNKDHEDYELGFLHGTYLPSDVVYRFTEGNDSTVLTKKRLDIDMKFHSDIHLRNFEREENALKMLKAKSDVTFWEWFCMTFPLASPFYNELLKKHNNNILFVLQDLKCAISFTDLLGEDMSDQFRASLNSRRESPNEHIYGRDATVDDLILATHHNTLQYTRYDENMLVKVIDDIGRCFPSLSVLPKFKVKDKALLENVILISARAGKSHAVRVALQTYASFEGCDIGEIAQQAMSTIIKYRHEPDKLDVLSTVDAILKYLAVPNTSAEELQKHIEKDDWNAVYSPILELSRNNKPFKGVTRRILQKLLKAGFDPEARDFRGRSAVDLAVLDESKEMFCALIDGFSKRDSVGQDARRRSSSHGDRITTSAWKYMNVPKVVDFIEKQEIPASTMKRLMQNNRVAGELIRRRIFHDDITDKDDNEKPTLIPVVSMVDGQTYLPVDFVEQFIDKMNYFIKADKETRAQRKEEKQGTRPVVGIEYNGLKVHVKIDSEFPVFELWAQEVVGDLIGFGTSSSHCVQFDKKSFEALIKHYQKNEGKKTKIRALERLAKGDPVRILISNTVEGQDCQSILKKNQGNIHAHGESFTEEQLANYMRFSFVMMLMIFRDAKADNIIKTLESFCLIDAGVNSLDPFGYDSAFHDEKLEFLCLMFAMDEMYENVFEKVMAEFLSVNVDEFWSRHFERFSELVGLHKDNFKIGPDVPKELEANWVFKHRTRFNDLQTALKKAVTRLIDDSDPMNVLEVLQRTLPNTRHAYREGFRKADTVQDRFIVAQGTLLNKLLMTIRGTKELTHKFAQTRKVLTQTVKSVTTKKAQYDPEFAIDDFQHGTRSDEQLDSIAKDLMRGDTTTFLTLRVENKSGVFSLDELREKVVNKIDFRNLDLNIQQIILDCLTSDEGKTDFRELRLSYCTALTKEILEKLLKNCSELRLLDLFGCIGLNTDGTHIKVLGKKMRTPFKKSVRDIIVENVPNLISLNLGGSSMQEVKFAGEELNSLKYLYLNDSPRLERAHCESPELKQLSLENNPVLRRIHFSSEILNVLNLKGCNLPAEVLHDLLKYASQLTRFTFDAGEEFSPRELAWFIFEGWRPDLSRLSQEHRISRHILRAMIDEDGILKLGELPITETDLNDIAALLASPENIKDPLGCKFIDLRGLRAHHRGPIRRLMRDMLTGKNGLEGIQCQPKIRPIPHYEPVEYFPTPSGDKIQNMISTPKGQLVAVTRNGNLYLVDTTQLDTDDPILLKESELKLKDSYGRIVRTPLIMTPQGKLISGFSHDLFLWDLDDFEQPVGKNSVQKKFESVGIGEHEGYGKVYSFVPRDSKGFVAATHKSLGRYYGHNLGAGLDIESFSLKFVDITSQFLTLPNLKLVFRSKKTKDTIRIQEEVLDSKLKSVSLESGDLSNMILTDRGTLLAFGEQLISEWDVESWELIKSYKNTSEKHFQVVQQWPNGEYIVYHTDRNDRGWFLYDSDFNLIQKIATSDSYITCAHIDYDGNLFFTTEKSLFCIRMQSVCLDSNLLKSLIETYQPLVIKNEIYLQPIMLDKKSKLICDMLEALFECEIKMIEEGSQAGTIRLKFDDTNTMTECYKYLYLLKNELAPDDILNPQSTINLSNITLSMDDIIELAEHSPNLRHIEGVELNDEMSIEDLIRIVTNSPGLMQLGDMDLSFRELMPKFVDLDETDESLTLWMSKSTSELKLDAFKQCCEYLERFLKVKVEKAQDVDNLSNAGICYSFKADDKDILNTCKHFIGALTTKKSHESLSISAIGEENKEDYSPLIKNARDSIRRSDSSFTFPRSTNDKQERKSIELIY